MDITTFMMSFALSGSSRPLSQTFTTSGSFVVPLGVTFVDMSGYGGRGLDAYYSPTTIGVRIEQKVYKGSTLTSSTTSYEYFNQSAKPEDSCTTDYVSATNTTTERCYYWFYVNNSYPASTGESATGLGKTFPGSYGNTAQVPTVFKTVAVTPGNYSIVVPPGGSITINYYG